MSRKNKVFNEPRKVLSAFPSVEMLEYESNRENSQCCGGPLMAYDAPLARNIAAQRVREAVDAGAQAIVANCPACVVNLREGAKTAGVQMEVQDLTMLMPKVMAKKKMN
jgi:Fe-S oxidoreductase